VLITELDFVGRKTDDLAQFFTVKQHVVWESSCICSPDDPRARGESECPFLIGSCVFMLESSSLELGGRQEIAGNHSAERV
jgi:hypothetical protein